MYAALLTLVEAKILGLDFFVRDWIMDLWQPAVIKAFAFVSLLGAWEIVLGFLVLVIALFLFYKKQNYILPLLVSVGGGELTVCFAKLIFRRPRPDIMLVDETLFSFPSGHAMISIAFYGFLAFVVIKHGKNLWQKVFVAAAGLVLVVLIGFSRLYLGAHYFSDVVVGYFIGSLWLCIAIYVSFAKIFKRL